MRDMSPREQEYADKGVEVLAVNAFENPAAGRAFIEGTDLELHWAFADDTFTEAMGIEGVPSQVILDAEGRVAWTSSLGTLFGGADAVYAALDEVLAAG